MPVITYHYVGGEEQKLGEHTDMLSALDTLYNLSAGEQDTFPDDRNIRGRWQTIIDQINDAILWEQHGANARQYQFHTPVGTWRIQHD